MKNEYSSTLAKKKINLITADMLYNIILNLKNNNMSFEDLASELGITVEELLNYISSQDKDFFVCLESLMVLEKTDNFEDYSRIKTLGDLSKK